MNSRNSRTSDPNRLLLNISDKIRLKKMINTLLYNIANNDYQPDSSVLYTFVPNKLFGQLLNISPKIFIFVKTFDSEFLYIEVWFTDQNSKPLEI